MQRRQSILGSFNLINSELFGKKKSTSTKFNNSEIAKKPRSQSFFFFQAKVESFEDNLTVEKIMKRKDHRFEAIPVLLTHCFILMNSDEKYFETEG
jgi:hypothetical protein